MYFSGENGIFETVNVNYEMDINTSGIIFSHISVIMKGNNLVNSSPLTLRRTSDEDKGFL